MRQPCGFVEKGKEEKVCRLHRSLYGLKLGHGTNDCMKNWSGSSSSDVNRIRAYTGSR